MKNLKSVLEEFDLLWGIAPPDSLKWRKGEDVKSFITSSLISLLEEVVPEAFTVPENVMQQYIEREKMGWNACRKQLLDNIETIKKL